MAPSATTQFNNFCPQYLINGPEADGYITAINSRHHWQGGNVFYLRKASFVYQRQRQAITSNEIIYGCYRISFHLEINYTRIYIY